MVDLMGMLVSGVLSSGTTGLIAVYMRLCDFRGWTSFWRDTYVLPGHENNDRSAVRLAYATK